MSNKLLDLEKKHISEVYEACGGNVMKTARTLGLHYKTLRRKMERYGLAFQTYDEKQADTKRLYEALNGDLGAIARQLDVTRETVRNRLIKAGVLGYTRGPYKKREVAQ